MHNSGQKAKLVAKGTKQRSQMKPTKSTKLTTKTPKRSLTTKSIPKSKLTKNHISTLTPSKLSPFQLTTLSSPTLSTPLFISSITSLRTFSTTPPPTPTSTDPFTASQQQQQQQLHQKPTPRQHQQGAFRPPTSNAPVNPFAKQMNKRMAEIQAQNPTLQQQKMNQNNDNTGDLFDKYSPEEEAQIQAMRDEDDQFAGYDSSISAQDESVSTSEIESSLDQPGTSTQEDASSDIGEIPKYRLPIDFTDNDIISDDPNVLPALQLGLEPPPRPDPTHVIKRRMGNITEEDSDLISEINTDNAPDYPQRIRSRSARTVTKVDENGLLNDSDLDAHPLYSDNVLYESDGSFSEYENQFHSESDIDWSVFETLGTVDKFNDKRNLTKLLDDVRYLDQNGKFRPGPLKIELPRLKKGAKIPKGWMVQEDGYCVPMTKEFVHHKYADPDLYQDPLHTRLANLVQEKLPKSLKLTPDEHESFYEVTQSGAHSAYQRHPDRVLKSPIIDNVIARINKRRGEPKVMDFEENIDLTFKTQSVSPFTRHYEYRMNAQGHALLDIPPRMLLEIRNRKKRSPHRLPGPSMDYTFMSTGYHKNMH